MAVNFYFQTMNIIVVEESEAITPCTFRNLAIAVGWALNLFLGSLFINSKNFITLLLRTIDFTYKKIENV